MYMAILFASAILSFLLAVPIMVFAIECLAGSLLAGKAPTTAIAIRPAVAVLVPAHDESSGIAETVRNIRREMRQGDRLVVVADNCSDDTADIARAEGAEVVERQNRLERGKGYALDAGIRYLSQTPPKIVVVIDADCRIGSGALDHLVSTVATNRRPAQALNLQIAPPGSGHKLAAAEFAYLVKNHVRPLGLLRLGLPCPLMGTGMALPWSLLEDARLASSHQVEDVKFSLDLARQGHTARFCPQALVTSYFPHSKEGTETQRRRWESGHLSMIFHASKAVIQPANWTKFGYMVLLFDILVPPLTLLGAATFAMTLISGLLALIGGPTLPFAVALINSMILLCSAGLAWAVHGRSVLPLRNLAQVPLYAMSKIRLYPNIAARNDVWVRTDRERRDHTG